MLDIHRSDAAPDLKIYFSHSLLPTYIDPQNVATKKKPFSAFNKQKFSHRLEVVLPEELYELVQNEIDRVDGAARAQYARVHMKVGEILEPDFLESYIKQGNIMMLSEGRPLLDNCFELYDGMLRMELNRPTYERCGLQGTPIEDGGKKHQKQRWVVEYDLKSPSMKHGGKAFSRLQRACKSVLDQSLTWLFYNFNPSSSESLAEGRETISKHAPWIHPIEPRATKMANVLVPTLSTGDLPSLYDEETALNLLEWVQMVGLDSPRIRQSDNIDPHLSRYEVPDVGHGVASTNMMCIRWRGFLPPAFMRSVFLAIRRAAFKRKNRIMTMEDSGTPNSLAGATWFAMSAHAFGGKELWTVLQFVGRDTLVWETES